MSLSLNDPTREATMAARVTGLLHGRWGGWLSAAAVGAIAFLVAAAITQCAPYAPRVHDEFSYLLSADTLLHGRLANPIPEVWQPFQSFHILVEPAYASKYPLGQGALTALGLLVLDTPIAGCWLAAGLCAACTVWLLGGVTSRKWACLGGLLVALHPTLQVTWSQSLISGWLTAAASALLAGGVIRLRRKFQWGAALASGTGIALLALTRPFEGLVATVISAGMLLTLWHGRELQFKISTAMRTIPIAILPIAAAISLIGLQNYAICGKATLMPYQLHEQKYGVAPLFVFGQPQTPALASTADWPAGLDAFHQGWSLDSYQARAGLKGWLQGIAEAFWTLWTDWSIFAIVPGLTLGYWYRYRVAKWLAVAVVLQMLISSTVCWIFAHYLSPALPWMVVLSVLGMRRLFHSLQRLGRFERSNFAKFAAAIIATQLVLTAASAVRLSADPVRKWALQRAAIQADLQSRPGTHLILVRYKPDHNVHREWVYNGADLETEKVLWARGERADWNQRLSAKYTQSRFVWELHADDENASPKLLSSPQ